MEYINLGTRSGALNIPATADNKRELSAADQKMGRAAQSAIGSGVKGLVDIIVSASTPMPKVDVSVISSASEKVSTGRLSSLAKRISNLFAALFALFSKKGDQKEGLILSHSAAAVADSENGKLKLTGELASHFEKGAGREQLEAYLSALDNGVTLNEALKFMERGEKIAEQLKDDGNFRRHRDDPFPTRPNQLDIPTLDDVRALSWFIMGKAGVTGDFVKSGSLRFPGGGYVLAYLNNAPTRYETTPSHYEEHVRTEDEEGTKERMCCIQDWDKKLPSEGGSISYNTLEDGTEFIKFDPPKLSSVAKMVEHSVLEKLKELGLEENCCRTFLETQNRGSDAKPRVDLDKYTHDENQIPSDLLSHLQTGLALLSRVVDFKSDTTLKFLLEHVGILGESDRGKALDIYEATAKASRLGLPHIKALAWLLMARIGDLFTKQASGEPQAILIPVEDPALSSRHRGADEIHMAKGGQLSQIENGLHPFFQAYHSIERSDGSNRWKLIDGYVNKKDADVGIGSRVGNERHVDIWKSIAQQLESARSVT